MKLLLLIFSHLCVLLDALLGKFLKERQKQRGHDFSFSNRMCHILDFFFHFS